MATPSTWLSLTDLGRIYGISAIHCGKALQKGGLRDQNGHPTPQALKVGAVQADNLHSLTKTTVWNSSICKTFFEKTGYQPISREHKIKQWVQLLEALEEGSPGIATTPDQMAEEIPNEFINEINSLLTKRGCHFQINTRSTMNRKIS